MKPSQIEKLPCLHEENNMFGMFRIKTYHMSDEKNCRPFTWRGFLSGEREADVIAQLSSTHYRRSLFSKAEKNPMIHTNKSTNKDKKRFVYTQI